VTTATTDRDLQIEIATLRHRLVEAERACQAAAQRAQLFEAVFQQLPIGVSLWHLEDPGDPFSLRLVAANAALDQVNQLHMRTKIGQRLIEVLPHLPTEHYTAHAEVLRSGQPRHMGESTYVDEHIGEMVIALQDIPLSSTYLCILVEDITERKRTEAALRQTIALEETIRAQNAVLIELSTPLIPLSDQVVVMPLIGTMDTRRAQQVIETLLQGIAASRVQIAILDITGVAVVDTQVANALIRAAQSIKLLGAQLVLTGIRPEVAQTLVGLGIDLRGIVTRSSLQSGIAYAISH
jgi:rsbT co-antagonist protein RsbR